jgi:hypothetical protein
MASSCLKTIFYDPNKPGLKDIEPFWSRFALKWCVFLTLLGLFLKIEENNPN